LHGPTYEQQQKAQPPGSKEQLVPDGLEDIYQLGKHGYDAVVTLPILRRMIRKRRR
jgi:hypothetical protein